MRAQIIPDALPDRLVDDVVDAMCHAANRCDVYRHPFEPKLQVPKTEHQFRPFLPMLEILYSGVMRHALSQMFDVPLVARPTSDYFTAFYLYRAGDYLQRHMDCAIHEDQRKVVTVNLYLTACEGGELTGDGLSVSPGRNVLVAFANDDRSHHAVKPILSGQRLMLTTGYVVPAALNLHGFAHANTKAWFEPDSDEQWSPHDYALRNQRAGMA